MRPKNFPECKRQRRIRALERLQAAMGRKPLLRQLDEADALAERIGSGSHRDVRTKKDRSGTAKLARA